jgi:hypothetical protein
MSGALQWKEAFECACDDITTLKRERDELIEREKQAWIRCSESHPCAARIQLKRERDEARRALDALTHLIRQHRCNCDGVPVGECVDSGRCGCSAALLTRAISTGDKS